MTLFDLASFVFHQIAIPTRDGLRPSVPATINPVASLYHIHAACRSEDIAHVESLIRQSLSRDCGVIKGFHYGSRNDGAIAVVDVEVQCSDHKRNHLVNVVSRLGLEPAVRSVSWNSMSKQNA